MQHLNSRNILATSSLLVVALFAVQAAQAETITALDGSQGWGLADMRFGGTADIVDIGSAGGNLQNNAPLPTGAVKLTTDANNASKAEVGIAGSFGTVGDFLNGGSLGYSFFKANGNTNTAAAASIKLTVSDSNITNSASGDGYTTFVYEPYWNQTPPLAAIDPPADEWLSVLIDGLTGTFWHTGVYGQSNQSGGGNAGQTLSGWNATFGGDLLDAVIVGLSVGIGTYNQGVTTYFDNVAFTNGDINLAYDFELAAVPVPAALPLALGGLAFLGFTGWRKRRHSSAA